MKAYFDSIEKEVPEALREVFLDRHDTAVITIDMHDGHLSTDPDCPCPSPRGREIIEPLNHFMDEARALGLPVIHVRSTESTPYSFSFSMMKALVLSSLYESSGWR